jgi:glycolate oxidase
MSIQSASKELQKALGRDSVLYRPEDLMVYEYDASLAKGTPDLVVLPQTTQDVVTIVKIAGKYKIPIVPRGSGTGLSGGSVPRTGGIVVTFSRMGRVLEVDVPNRRAVVQPGVVNSELSVQVAKHGLYFAPDPSSQRASTIGGNVAENSGGPHTLAQGVTVNHITGLEVVLPSGEVIELGGKSAESAGYDLTGFFTGSEGLLGIVTKITVKLTRLAESVATLLAVYNTVEDAAQTVISITSAGITPAALEMLDGVTLRAVEAATHAGFPLDSAAVLLVELEGLREAVEEHAELAREVCMRHNAREVRRAKDDAERMLLWKGRKTAFASLGRITPAYYSQDVVVPRTKIPEILRFIEGVSKKYNQRVGNIFHAGDGNLHPAIMFDLRDPAQVERTHQAGFDICAQCIKMGGTITGEHGVGMEKQALMSLLFTDNDLDVMKQLHDAFNPDGLMNPQKVCLGTRGGREGVV